MATIKIDQVPPVLATYLVESERSAGMVDLDDLHRRRRAAERFAEREARGRVPQRYRDPKHPDLMFTTVKP